MKKADSSTGVFPVNIAKFFKKTYFEEYLRMAASECLEPNYISSSSSSHRKNNIYTM